MKNKYLISLILIGLSLAIGLFYLVNQEEGSELNEVSCATCGSKQKESKEILTPKIEDTGKKTFEDDVRFSAVATFEGSQTKYFNWRPQNPCPNNGDCYLSNITARVTFLNTGDSSILSEKGAGYIQIANGKESNCADPSQAIFTRYLAYSLSLHGGESWTKRTCGESTTPNTCNLSFLDDFDKKSDCFSLKLSAQNTNDGEINFVTHLLFLTYTWVWEPRNSNETQ